MEVIFFYHTTGMHPKSHIFSNGLTEYILDNKLEHLHPSTRASIPLHDGLIHSDFSPVTAKKSRESISYKLIGHLYSGWISRESLENEAMNLCAFAIHRYPSTNVPFVEYLKGSRNALKTILLHHGLSPGLLEPLFNHIVVHYIDHDLSYSVSWNLEFGVKLRPERPGLYERFRSLFARWQLVKPNYNPLDSNKIRDSKIAFYRDVYWAMSKDGSRHFKVGVLKG